MWVLCRWNLSCEIFTNWEPGLKPHTYSRSSIASLDAPFSQIRPNYGTNHHLFKSTESCNIHHQTALKDHTNWPWSRAIDLQTLMWTSPSKHEHIYFSQQNIGLELVFLSSSQTTASRGAPLPRLCMDRVCGETERPEPCVICEGWHDKWIKPHGPIWPFPL